MSRLGPEKRSTGAQIAFIDLLFLLIAFFTLVIFFIETKRTEIETQLESTQEQLAQVSEERDIFKTTIADLGPGLMQFMAFRRQEAEHRRELAARELRKAQRPEVRLRYEVLPERQILYEGREYSLAAFKSQVVGKLREDSWIAFRAYARPATPFGDVVASRAEVLQNSGEFDTYWDNVTREAP
ncbi:MAG: hypothetical protein HY342_03985 [Candidatus Lambdaproteobacteria bacterium]|nr:hypothetical protein [Candidatus Lambdaproteobacteria bacterium]